MKNSWLIQFNALAVAAVLAFSSASLSGQDSAPAANGPRTDGQIEMDVVQALDASQALKNDLITAATIESKVTLSGTVASDADRQLAESIVKKVPGVNGVKNNLKVGNPTEAANAEQLPEDSSPYPADEQAQNNASVYDPQPGQEPAPQSGNGQQPDPNYPQPNQQQPAYGQQPGSNYPQPNQQRPAYGQPQAPGYGQQPPQYGQGNYPPPPPNRRQPYNQGNSGYAVAPGPITILPGTVLQLRTADSIDSKYARQGTPIDFTVLRDVLVNGYLAIPRGATVRGVVTDSTHAGQLTGSAELGLQLTSLEMEGHSYPLQSDLFRVKGPSKTGRTVGNVIGGALIGTLIGGAAGGGGGAAIGAVAGGTVGTAASAAGNPRAWIPAEALVTFHLNAPVTVDPVSREEASRLAQGLYPGGPTLYQRGPRPGPYGYPGPGYYAYPGAYGYPPVYYRPYYFVGGAYYWR